MTSTERLWMTREAHTRLKTELAALRSRRGIEVPEDFMDYDDNLMAEGVRTTSGWRAPDVRWRLTLEKLTADVLVVVVPDDENDPEPHPWSWLAELARARGLEVTADDLRAAVRSHLHRRVAPMARGLPRGSAAT